MLKCDFVTFRDEEKYAKTLLSFNTCKGCGIKTNVKGVPQREFTQLENMKCKCSEDIEMQLFRIACVPKGKAKPKAGQVTPGIKRNMIVSGSESEGESVLDYKKQKARENGRSNGVELSNA